jgi:hypothetical protein
MIPILVAYIAVMIAGQVTLLLVTSPWTLYFYTANWGLLSRDRKTTRAYAERIQMTNPTVNNMLAYVRRSGHLSKSAHLHFYPHKAKRWFVFVPFLISMQGTDYTFPPLTELFTRLEDSGWKRKDVYALFAAMTSDGATREKINEVRRRVCRGEITTKMIHMWGVPLEPLGAWVEAPPNMWTANRAVVDVDMSDTTWILAGGALIRARDRETLKALDMLNQYLGMWKFVKTEDDLRVEGYWQYIVL